MQHPSGIPEKIVRKVFARRGRLHAFEAIDPRTTALVVIDLDEATVANDDVSQRMTPTVNALAAAVRQSGGVVAWVLSRMRTSGRVRTSSGCCADRRCRKVLQVAARAYHWIEQEFLRLFHPQTFVLAGPAARHQGIHLNAHDVGGPSGPPLVRATHDVRPVPGPVRKPVIVEHVPVVAEDDDVIAGVAGRWPNPFGRETAVRILFEERVRQHVTRAGGEEDAVRERPLFCGIALRTGRASLVHGGSIPRTAGHVARGAGELPDAHRDQPRRCQRPRKPEHPEPAWNQAASLGTLE
jgi:hypothetical protein